MNESRLALLAAALVLALPGGCTKSQGSTPPPLQGARIGGAFDLTDQDGKEVRDTDFSGKYRLVYFGYTYCPDVCPIDLQLIGLGLRQFEKDHPDKSGAVQPIFISVDPERDTPTVLKQYVSAFHPRLIGLTGSPEAIAATAKRYGVYYTKHKQPGSSEYLVDHSRMAMLFGPDGNPISIVPDDKGPAGVAAELDRWVQ